MQELRITLLITVRHSQMTERTKIQLQMQWREKKIFILIKVQGLGITLHSCPDMHCT